LNFLVRDTKRPKFRLTHYSSSPLLDTASPGCVRSIGQRKKIVIPSLPAQAGEAEGSAFCFLLFAFCFLLFAFCFLLFAFCFLLFAFCFLLFAFCLSLFAFRFSPVDSQLSTVDPNVASTPNCPA